ncbi:acetoin utilization protein AcuC [Cognatishimia sp. MH4019]|uniref:acetoin utilization protein AcuC n=1 Tax=Cognatishimia sp. MH4019 TaxID=2854030 RepID=UPI001CD495AB|nr:acetoin utilization protein AcuC [Cognatishimia sp. MH4019]
MTAPLFLGSEIYRGSSYGDWHPLRVPRVSTAMDLSRALGWLPDQQYVNSPRAKPKALHVWHEPDYVAALQRAEATQEISEEDCKRFQLGTVSNPIYPEVYRRPATAAGASLLSGELLRDGGVIYHPGGGTHHGMPGYANGFCYLNDPVLAILSLKRNGARRVAYIDIDAHHADGVEHGFADDPDTLLISVHEEGRWPRTGALTDRGVGQVFNLPVPRGLNDTEMAMVRDRLIVPLVSDFAPDAIVLQCGADAVEEDPLSKLTLSNNAHWAVVSALKALSAPRFLVLGGGGYNPWSVGRLWTGVWGVLNGHHVPDVLPVEAQEVLLALRWDGARRGKNRPEHWVTTLRDAPREGSVRTALRDRVDWLLSDQTTQALRVG